MLAKLWSGPGSPHSVTLTCIIEKNEESLHYLRGRRIKIFQPLQVDTKDSANIFIAASSLLTPVIDATQTIHREIKNLTIL